MATTIMKMADFNENEVKISRGCRRAKVSGEILHKENGDIVQCVDTELFPELHELSQNPEKFVDLALTLDENPIEHVLEDNFIGDPEDLDLLHYFSRGDPQNLAELGIVKKRSVSTSSEMVRPTDQHEVELHIIESLSSNDVNNRNMQFMEILQSDSRENSCGSSSPMSFHDDDDDFTKLPPVQSMSKNAVAARENRQRKKKYISGLEESVNVLTGENKSLKKQLNQMEKSVSTLTTEVEYLKSVLANSSTLSALLKNVCATPGVEFTSSFGELVRNEEHDLNCEIEEKKPMNLKRKLDVDNEMDDLKENQTQLKKRMAGRVYSTSAQHRFCKSQKQDHDYASDNQVPKVVLERLPNSQKQRCLQKKATLRKNSGVCLHVANNLVSLEFCAQCSNKASSSKRH